MVELDFLTMCYEVHGLGSLPLTLLYGVDSQELASSSLPNNIRLVSVSFLLLPAPSYFYYTGSHSYSYSQGSENQAQVPVRYPPHQTDGADLLLWRTEGGGAHS